MHDIYLTEILAFHLILAILFTATKAVVVRNWQFCKRSLPNSNVIAEKNNAAKSRSWLKSLDTEWLRSSLYEIVTGRYIRTLAINLACNNMYKHKMQDIGQV